MTVSSLSSLTTAHCHRYWSHHSQSLSLLLLLLLLGNIPLLPQSPLNQLDCLFQQCMAWVGSNFSMGADSSWTTIKSQSELSLRLIRVSVLVFFMRLKPLSHSAPYEGRHMGRSTTAKMFPFWILTTFLGLKAILRFSAAVLEVVKAHKKVDHSFSQCTLFDYELVQICGQNS